MENPLPKPKRNLKTFILEEDAKVIDKTLSKVAISASFLALSFALNVHDANAKGHKDHANHSNFVYHEGNDPQLGNDGNTTVQRTYSSQGQSVSVEVPPKNVASVHANHFNHQNGAGGKS